MRFNNDIQQLTAAANLAGTTTAAEMSEVSDRHSRREGAKVITRARKCGEAQPALESEAREKIRKEEELLPREKGKHTHR